MEVKLRWRVLDRMYTAAPTRKSKEELDALLFDRAARSCHTNPYEETLLWTCTQGKSEHGGRNAKIGCHTSKIRVCRWSLTSDLLKAFSDKEAEAYSDVDAFMEHCAKRWQTREGTYQLKRCRLKPDVRDPPESGSADVELLHGGREFEGLRGAFVSPCFT